MFFDKGSLERTTSYVVYPFLWTANSVSSMFKNISQQKMCYETLRTNYEKLQKDYVELLDEVIKSRATQHAYNDIKELTEFQQRYNNQQATLAKILLKHIDSSEHYYLVNRGTRDNIHPNMIALYHNHLVGKVSDVYDFYSKIVLITDQHCKVAAYTNKTQATGIVQGYNNINRCTLSYVSHFFKIEDHDMVLSSGQGFVFPEGFCLGSVISHVLAEKSLYHYIEIAPLINFEAIHYCILVEPSAIKAL
jgi:rod shape-determining protein MreC